VTDRDEGRFANALGTLAALFRFDVGASVPGYWAGCRSLTIDDFEAACLLAAEKCEHMPVPAHLLKLARESRAKAEGRIQIGQGEWVADPWRQPTRQLTGNVSRNAAPPLSTYAECIESCQQNMDKAIERARCAVDGQTKALALADVRHWREMRVWYEAQVAAGRGDEQISLGGFAPPAGQTPHHTLPVQPQAHWSEGREVGADDDVEDVA